MIHPWIDSRKFLLMQSRMTHQNLFQTTFKSRFMIPSGFSWFCSKINTWAFNQEILLVFTGDFCWGFWLNTLLIFLRWPLISLQARLFWVLHWVSFGSFQGDLRIESMNHSRPFLETPTRLIVSLFLILVKHPGLIKEPTLNHSFQTSTRLFIKTRIYTWGSLW